MPDTESGLSNTISGTVSRSDEPSASAILYSASDFSQITSGYGGLTTVLKPKVRLYLFSNIFL